jgi:hypothetical protein
MKPIIPHRRYALPLRLRANRFVWLLVGGVLFMSLMGCAARPEGLAPIPDGPSIALPPSASIGQTFSTAQTGLHSIAIYLPSAPAGPITLRMHLRASPLSSDDLAVVDLPLGEISQPGFVTFFFPPPANDDFQNGYFEIESLTGETVTLAARSPASYADGSLYVDGTPAEGQLVFLLGFDQEDSAKAECLNLLRWAGYAFLVVALFALPGFAICDFWPAFAKLRLWEKAALLFASGLALAPLVFEFANQFGWTPGEWWVALLIGGALLLIAIRRHRNLPALLRDWGTSFPALKPDLASITTAILLALVFWTRMEAVRGLSIPMWGDSLAHSEITQLILDHGGLFSSWEPYAPIGSMTYHFGFHAQTALFAWLAGLQSWTAVLVYGQLLNVLAILALIPLANRLSGSRWGGALAVLAAGLLSPMPMIYTDWGRYTQLAGQAILPLVLWVTLAYLEEESWRSHLIWIGGLLWAGLALTHYRVLIMGMAILPGVFLFGRKTISVRIALTRITAMGLIGLVLFMPWLTNQIPRHAATDLLNRFAPATTAMDWLPTYNALGDITGFIPLGVWLLLPLGLLVGLIGQKRASGVLAAWVIGWIAIANPQWLHLPGQGIINNTAIEIAGYIPIALAASLLAAIPIAQHRMQLARGAAVALVGIGLWEIAPRIADVTPANYALATAPDLRAAAWIEANTPAEAKFVINSFSAYGGEVLVGADGGWWLPLLAHRTVDIPPLLYFSEAPSSPQANDEIWQIDEALRKYGLHAAMTRDTLRQYGYRYIYIGHRQGAVNNPSPAILQPAELAADPGWELVYHQDRVWIFRVRSAAEPAP